MTDWLPGPRGLQTSSPKKKRVRQSSLNMDKPLGVDDFAAMEGQLRQYLEEDRRYSRINEVKCDAIHTAKTYEEFADRVAAAHLRPLEKGDYKNQRPRSWNQFATKNKNDRE